ncbi:glycosyltransferase [Oscillatoria sp. CS-180]|uniref:glycosyltransferase n=1 Tax=Oscillatoria sp. CS-180 TaxID=3021720 RepID=UPI00232EFE04|nr:glycosyltransferase [Oscillatoria sp. CS-180]MDB9527127.1 glycosyltransferase [Oscillatoria sp. CS-180]
MERPNCPFVSVIIPVYNDAGRLRLCLAALSTQTYPRSRFEIIVIDNGSDYPERTKAATASLNRVTVVSEPTPGSYAARNRGLAIAQGEAIAFTDADCIPDSDWLERGIAHLQQTPNCGQVVGKVNLFFANPDRPTAVELYESLTAFPQERLLKEFHGGATANVFTWRRVIEDVGPFNTRLKSNGDLEWGGRVFDRGYAQVYAADVQVAHPARRSLGELHKRTVRLAGGVIDRLIRPDDKFIQRQKMFARLLVDDLTPPVNFVINTFRNSDLKHWQHKLKASLVIFYVRYVSAGEKLRLKFGGASNRG